jgi:hypothetical protein
LPETASLLYGEGAKKKLNRRGRRDRNSRQQMFSATAPQPLSGSLLKIFVPRREWGRLLNSAITRLLAKIADYSGFLLAI